MTGTVLPPAVASLLDRCTVEVHGAGYAGTGFFVAPGTVLTCAHVAAAEPYVMWAGRRLEVSSVTRVPETPGDPGFYAFPDLGLLRLDDPPEHPYVWLAEDAPPIGAVVFARGFGRTLPRSDVHRDGLRLTVAAPAGPFLRVTADRVVHGHSGSPVIDPATGRVCGIVKGTRGGDEGGWLIPASAIAAHVPDIAAANAAVEDVHRQWASAAEHGPNPASAMPGAALPGAGPPGTGPPGTGAALPGPGPADPAGPGLAGVSVNPPSELRPPVLRGRDDLVRELCASVAEPDGTVHVLCGIAGGGKTSVALEVAERVAGETDVYWLRAGSSMELRTGLLAVAQARGATPDELSVAARGELSLPVLLRRLLTGGRRWLVVLDNADDPAELSGGRGFASDAWWPPGRHGLVLATSRSRDRRQWGTRALMHRVDVLSEAEGAAVLCDLAPDAGDEAGARALSGRLGGLALALRAAGAYLAAEPLGGPETFAEYRAALDERFTEIVDAGTRLDAGDEATARELVMQTWQLSLDRLEPMAADVLGVLSCFAAIPVPEKAVGVVQDIDRHVRALVTLHLVDRVRAGPSELRCLALHPLVQEVTWSRLSEEGGPTLPLVAQAMFTSAYVPEMSSEEMLYANRRAELDLVAVHAVTLAERVDPPPGPALEAWRNLADIGVMALTASTISKNLDGTEGLLGRLRAAARRVLPPGDEIFTKLDEVQALLEPDDRAAQRPAGDPAAGDHARIRIARRYAQTGELDAAEAELRAVLRRGDLGDHDERAARTLLAVVDRKRGDARSAADQLTRLLAESTRAVPVTSPELLDLRKEHLRALQELDAGERDDDHIHGAYEDLLRDTRQVFGDDHAVTLDVLCESAHAAFLRGDVAAAEAELRDVLDRAGERAQRQARDARAGLVTVLSAQRRFAEAERIQRELIPIYAGTYGADAPETLQSREKLVELLLAQGHMAKARKEFQRLLRQLPDPPEGRSIPPGR